MTWRAVRTVAVLELRQRVRSTRWRIMLALWAVVLVALCGGLTALFMLFSPYPTFTEATPVLYDLIVCFVMGIGLAVAPALSATSINGDRADATLALLQATALRSGEIVVGKAVAACVAALAFLGVALPFLVGLTAFGGSSWAALAGHVLTLVVVMGSVCAVGLGISATTARPSASTVLTYLAVTALVIGLPIAMTVSMVAVQDTQHVTSYARDYSGDEEGESPVCETYDYDQTIIRTERIWWITAPQPFVVLSDISVRAPSPELLRERDDHTSFGAFSPLASYGWSLDEARTPQPTSVVHGSCQADGTEGDVLTTDDEWDGADHPPFWPVSLALTAGVGALWLVAATRRLRTPAGKRA